MLIVLIILLVAILFAVIGFGFDMERRSQNLENQLNRIERQLSDIKNR